MNCRQELLNKLCDFTQYKIHMFIFGSVCGSRREVENNFCVLIM